MKAVKHQKKRLFLPVFLVLIMTLCQPAMAAYTPDVEVQAKAYYLYNIDTDTVIAEKNADKQMAPASLTKIMTCILALENTKDLDAEKCVYPNYIQDYLYDYQWTQKNGAVSLGGLDAGEELSMRQLLYAAMLPSANEAAMVIADHIGGSQEAFVKMMNKRAKELGATNTTFVNANGLYAKGHVTTARDMAKITLHAMELPGFMEIVSSPSYDSGPTSVRDNITWTSTIKMQIPDHELYYEGLQGVKTGSVPEAGDCFISTCTRDGFTYLLVILGSEYLDKEGNALPVRGSFTDTANLYDWVFDHFTSKALVEKNSIESEAPVDRSFSTDHVRLMAGERFTYLIPKTMDASEIIKEAVIPESVDAPIEKGEQIGQLKLKIGNEEIGSVPLLAAESVKANFILVILDTIGKILGSFVVKFLLILLLLFAVFYAVLLILRNRNRRRYGNRRRPRNNRKW